MSTKIIVDYDVEETLPAVAGPAEFVKDRRRGVAGAAPGHAGLERRRIRSPRLERRRSGLAVVRTCPACGRVSVTPYEPGSAAVAAALQCPCTAAIATTAATAAPAPNDYRVRALIVTCSLVLLWLLNVEDIILTRTALSLGATEANALMAFFLSFGFTQAVLFKMGIVTAGSIFLWTQRRHRAALLASVGLATVYLGVVTFQVVQLSI
jgi:hypothetical protein